MGRGLTGSKLLGRQCLLVLDPLPYGVLIGGEDLRLLLLWLGVSVSCGTLTADVGVVCCCLISVAPPPLPGVAVGCIVLREVVGSTAV